MNPNHPDVPDRGSGNRGAWFAIFCFAGLIMLIGVFYAVENWRGKRAWNQAKREALAKGARLDWKAFMPAPVPDSENVFKAPHMQEWFVKAEANKPGRTLGLTNFGSWPPASSGAFDLTLARIQMAPGTANKPGEHFVIRAGDSNAPALLARRLRFPGALPGGQGIVLLARPVQQIAPSPIRVEIAPGATVNAAGIQKLLPPASAILADSSWAVSDDGSNAFTVTLHWRNSSYLASDYINWTDQFQPQFDTVRQALKRPLARMEGDYSRPFGSPVPNFVALRQVAQVLAQRAQAFLLLGKPDAALQELSLVLDVCRVLQTQPAGQSVTLVSAMIEVAIAGLYANVVADGFRLAAWGEPHLQELQQQAARVRLLPKMVAALEAERAGLAYLLERSSRSELRELFSAGPNPKGSLLQELEPQRLLMRYQPQGWLDQNRATIVLLETKMLAGFDLSRAKVSPAVHERAMAETQATLTGFSPYTWLAAMGVPNFSKATQTLARNQSLADEIVIACALERFRLAQGHYPEALAQLYPAFADALPQDLITGAPYKYRRGQGATYVLYSVGWDEVDDGGVPSADWLWQGVPKWQE